jgi:hypothetical protein
MTERQRKAIADLIAIKEVSQLHGWLARMDAPVAGDAKDALVMATTWALLEVIEAFAERAPPPRPGAIDLEPGSGHPPAPDTRLARVLGFLARIVREGRAAPGDISHPIVAEADMLLSLFPERP